MNPLFRLALLAGSEEAVGLHLRRGTDVAARDEHGTPPLHIAVAKGHLRVCALLLDAGADPLAADASGKTALTLASETGPADLIELIASHCRQPGERSEKAAIESSLPPPGNVDRFDELDSSADEWKPYEDTPPPAEEKNLAARATQVQEQIAAFRPINRDPSWTDVEADLPPKISPKHVSDRLLRGFESLVESALDFGWVPAAQLEQLRLAAAVDADRFLHAARLALEQLDATLMDDADDCPAISKSPPASDRTYELEIRPALEYLEWLLSDQAEPLLLYYKDIRPARAPLLTTAEELELGSAISEAIDSALGAIVACPATRVAASQTVQAVACGVASREVLAERGFPGDERTTGASDEVRGMTSAGVAVCRDAYPGTVAALCARLVLRESPQLPEELLNARISLRFLKRMSDIAAREATTDARSEVQSAITRIEGARNRLVEANLRLVPWVAKRYLSSGVEFIDLVQEGNIGLIRAAEKFDHRLGFRFSTFASWWIRAKVSRAAAEYGRTIRIPAHTAQILVQILSVRWSLGIQEGEPPSAEEIAAALDLPVTRVVGLLPFADELVPLDDLREAEESLGTGLCDPRSLQFEIDLLRRAVRQTVLRLLDSLKGRERQILRLRFGFDGSERTLQEIGDMLHVTRERVRQIEAIVLKRVRRPLQRAGITSLP